MGLFLSPHIRWVNVADDVVFLDLRNDLYSAAGGVAAAQWRALTGGLNGTRPFNGAVLPTGDADQATVFADRDFIASALPVAPSRQIASGPGLSRRLSAARIIRRTAAQLRREGLWSVYHDALRLDRRAHAHDPAACLRSFVAGENLVPLRRAPKDCLPRSLALYRYLLGCGVSAEHVIGVQTRPFSAHAWVEQNGIALLEAMPPHYRPIARMSPKR